MSINIKVERKLSDEFVGDILVTAFDGSYGGCWYWARPAQPEWLHTQPASDARSVAAHWTQCDIVERDEEGQDTPAIRRGVSGTVIERGIQRILSNNLRRGGVNEHIRDAILRGVLQHDAGEIDAEDADCIVQAGLFSEIVYS